MIIGDFNLERIAVSPDKAYPELVVNPDTVLSFAITFQWFQVVAGEKTHIRELLGGMNLNEFSFNHKSQTVESF
jgi:hypothetical protein